MIRMALYKTLHAPGAPLQLDIRCTLERGQLVTLYGPSGAGKTSILRMLAGLLAPDKGGITVHEKVWLDTAGKINLRPQDRKIGFVFQDYALFPNMTVQKNLEYALGRSGDQTIIGELIDMMELGELRHRRPDTLSGGQKQRVALARALVQQPDILLLDEPLSALDSAIRLKLQDYLLQVHRRFGLTTILVSHDIGEILRLSDKVFVLDRGMITREGTPVEVFAGGHALSAKFRFTGEVINIEKEEVVYIVTVLIATYLVRIIAQESEITDLRIGDKVMVASKAFNPIIRKI